MADPGYQRQREYGAWLGSGRTSTELRARFESTEREHASLRGQDTPYSGIVGQELGDLQRRVNEARQREAEQRSIEEQAYQKLVLDVATQINPRNIAQQATAAILSPPVEATPQNLTQDTPVFFPQEKEYIGIPQPYQIGSAGQASSSLLPVLLLLGGLIVVLVVI